MLDGALKAKAVLQPRPNEQWYIFAFNLFVLVALLVLDLVKLSFVFRGGFVGCGTADWLWRFILHLAWLDLAVQAALLDELLDLAEAWVRWTRILQYKWIEDSLLFEL